MRIALFLSLLLILSAGRLSAEPDADGSAGLIDEDRIVADNPRMRYFCVRAEGVEPPPTGYRLLVVLPGGDGSADFHPFVKRIFTSSLDDSWLLAQVVAAKWTPEQRIVWPTDGLSVAGQEFSTEQFVGRVVDDVRLRHKLDGRHIYTLSWSSSGPAAYAIALARRTVVTGSYIAMSVFKPQYLPPPENARGRVFYLDHSPDDRLCPIRMAREAEASLTAAGAMVRFHEYQGGHGWRGDVYGRIRKGLEWMTAMNQQDTHIGATPPWPKDGP